MTVQEIIKLGEMGYSKEDIVALTAAETQPVQPVQPVQQTQQPDFLEALKLIGQTQPEQQAIQTPPVQQIQPAQPTISLTAEDLVKLTQGIAVKTAAGSVETPRSANDIILGMLDAYESITKEDK